MAEFATIARPYAEALFRVAKAGDVDTWSELVDEMAQVAGHPDVVALSLNPKLSASQMAETFLSAIKSSVSPEAKNFIYTLTENGRLTLLPIIATQFRELKNADSGSADALITSAFDISEAQVKDLIATLEKKFGRKLHPQVHVDSTLIGGVRIVVGDQVLDTSVRAKLEKMHTALTI